MNHIVPLSGKDKLDEVTRIMGLLREDTKDGKLPESTRQVLLEHLRVYGRQTANAGPIFTKEGIETLTKQGLDSTSLVTSREALRCLANALLLDAKTRQFFVDLGYAGKAAERLKKDNTDDEFLICRLLFLTTYDSNLNFDELFEKHQLGTTLNSQIARHAKQFSKGDKKFQLPQADEQALSETLKLIFNITNFYPHLAEAFSPSIPGILKILSHVEIPSPPLQQPVTYLINALLNLDLEENKSKALGGNPLFPEFNHKINADKWINILDAAVATYTPAQLEKGAMPLVTLLRKLYEIAPESVQKCMRRLLLPKEEDRDLPVGQDGTLSSRLLKLSLAPDAPNLREAISSLMFELSGKDASLFVKNVGYGFAAGFLTNHQLAMPENAKAAFSTANGKGPVNPITGQRLDAEPEDTLPEMTEEEKEREAEKLFVLFQRLKATGVVNFKDPMETAKDEGRFEELDD